MGVAGDAEGGAGAGFDADEVALVGEVSGHLLAEHLQAASEAADDPGREQFVQPGRVDAGEVAGWGEGGGVFAGEEIGDALGGGDLAAAAGGLGGGFEGFLKGHAGEDAVFGLEGLGILGFDGDDHAAVGEGGVPAGEAHAVDDDFVVFGGGGDDEAAGAHAKGVDAAVVDFGGEAVAGGGEQAGAFLMPGKVVLEVVDERLGMLDAQADGEGFLFEADVLRVQLTVDVAGGVAGGEDEAVGGELASVGGGDASDGAVVDQEAVDPCAEMDFAAGRSDRFAQGHDDFGEEVGTDVGVGVDEDAPGGAVGDECFVDLANGASLGGPGVEFAVGEGAGSAFAEAVVGVFDHAAFLEDGAEVEAAGGGVLASFQQDGLAAEFDAAEGGEHAGRAAADDEDGAGSGGQGGVFGAGNRFGGQFAVEADFETEPHFDLPLAGVDGVLAQAEAADAGGVDVELCGNGRDLRVGVLGPGEGQDDVDQGKLRGIGGHVRKVEP